MGADSQDWPSDQVVVVSYTSDVLRAKLYSLSLCSLAGCLAACGTDGRDLRMVVGGLEANQEITRSVAEFIDAGDAFRVRQVNQDESSALEMLIAGEADLALVENTSKYRPGIASLLPVYAGVLHVSFREMFALETARESLVGKTIFAGARDSLSYSLTRGFLASIGMPESSVTITTDLGDPPPDAIAALGPISPERLRGLAGYSLFSMGTPESLGRGSLVDGVRTYFPQVRPYIIPAGTYGELTAKPIVTLAVDMVLVGRDDIDPAAVYDLILRLTAGRPALAAEYPAIFDGMSTDFDPDALNFPLHAGARMYLDRDEPSIYERYADVVDAGITLFLFVLSGSLALARFLTMRRKNRIDVFYENLLAIRDRLRAGMEPDERRAALARVQALEDEAFKLLIDEKLAANESFRIFMTLSHDVMRELE